MAEARLRPKRQITIPAPIIKEANWQIGVVLNIAYADGVITLRPLSIEQSAKIPAAQRTNSKL